jgi:hypothetical protein
MPGQFGMGERCLCGPLHAKWVADYLIGSCKKSAKSAKNFAEFLGTNENADEAKCLSALCFLGWLMGLEPTTTGITILDSTN